ncbi:hypothetical protein CNYM01_03325 [Colletotrichum nymphaeae SA-01]|uniref:Cyanovirin-N domain-containing protein n=1 Tax=Colletotrichum nymphaeae SA-01 TaxID=1460502 RepID=A0A135TQS1_9PEZI|nr:hypothetical protein CNYM01_03325 [Colletotrichum nymphaeae SA-01]
MKLNICVLVGLAAISQAEQLSVIPINETTCHSFPKASSIEVIPINVTTTHSPLKPSSIEVIPIDVVTGHSLLQPSPTQAPSNCTCTNEDMNKPATDKRPAEIPYWGFKQSCTEIHGDGGEEAVIWACCDTAHGYGIQNRFRLGQCIENARGKLIPRKNGGFWRTCEDCGLKDPERPTVYSCKCWPMPRHGAKHERVEAEIELNDFIGNDHGKLVCFGVREQRYWGNCTNNFPWDN